MEKIILLWITFFARKSYPLRLNLKNYGTAIQATDDNVLQAHTQNM